MVTPSLKPAPMFGSITKVSPARALCRVAALGAVLVVGLAPPTGAQAPPSLLEQLRRVLGMQRTVVVGGSRAVNQQLCVLSPLVDSGAEARTPSGEPPIAASLPLSEVQILRDTTLLWRRKASSSQPLPSPLAWPIAPLQPGDVLTLKLRAYGAEAGQFAVIQLSRPSTGTPTSETLRLATAMESLLRAVLAGDAAQARLLTSLQQQACGGNRR